MGEARWEHLASVAWVPDLWDDVVSDLSVLHRVADPGALSSARFFALARRLVHYPGAVRFELSQRAADGPQSGSTAPPATEPAVPQVRTAEEARALRDRLRRNRFPETVWGPMRRVSVAEINNLGVPGG